ncbi:phage baseplate plug family protein [Rahnella aceris]|uniref:phage baseplate plug family protein n=1 Tax=Rahnella sp. (strain Y9602) TaxID=2703885 RepID=UPI003BA2F76E
MSYAINIPDVPYSSQQVTLGDQPYILEIVYKERTDRYYITLGTTTGVRLLTEKKILNGATMTGLFDLGMSGELFVTRNFGTGDKIGWGKLGIGKEFGLQFLTRDEVNFMSNHDFDGYRVDDTTSALRGAI